MLKKQKQKPTQKQKFLSIGIDLITQAHGEVRHGLKSQKRASKFKREREEVQ